MNAEFRFNVGEKVFRFGVPVTITGRRKNELGMTFYDIDEPYMGVIEHVTVPDTDLQREEKSKWGNEVMQDGPISLHEHCRQESGLEGPELERYIKRHYGH